MVASNTTAVTFQPGYNQSFVMGQWNVGWLNGYIYEILIYNRALSLGEYQSVEGYLSQKWGFSPAKVFTPLSVPTCIMWLDGADPTTMSPGAVGGGQITAWRDKSSNAVSYASGAIPNYAGCNVQPPTYVTGGGLNFNPSIPGGGTYTNGTTQGLVAAGGYPLNATGFTAFAVAIATGTMTTFNSYFSWWNAGATQFIDFDARSGNCQITTDGGGTLNLNPASTTLTTTRQIQILQGTTTGANFFVNGTLTNTTSYTYTQTSNPVAVNVAIGNQAPGFRSFSGTIYELLVYNSALTAAQRQAVEGYLASKWGLQGSLALAHPNYLTTGNFVRSLTLATTHPYYSLPPATRAFTPLDVPGCQIWLDAADLSSFTFSSGTTISSWKDKSGFGNNFTSTAGTNTRIADGAYSVVSFSTGNYMSSTNQVPLALTSSFFVVVKVLDIGGINMIVGCTNITSGGNLSDFSIRIIDGLLNGTSAKLGNEDDIGNQTYYVNGSFNPNFGTSTYNNTYSIIDTMVSGKSGTTYITLSSAFGSNRYLKGNIAEFLFYPGGVTGAQRQAVEGYLANKWGLKASIPVFTNPTSIPSCAMWLDGADSTTMFQNTAGTTPITADGQTIAAWRDKSANGYLFIQPTTGNQPVYKTGIQNGSSITRWNGTSTGLQSSTTLPFYTSASSGGSFFFVFMVTSNNTQRFLMTYQNQTSGTFCVSESEIGCPTGNSDAGNFGIHQGCGKANVALNQITTNTYVMMNLNLLSSGTAPANTTIFKNGTSAAMTAQNGGFYSGTTYPSANNARNLNIGYRVPVGTFSIDCWLAGDIAEIVWYQTPLSSAQQQQVEGYLAWKWGLQAQLPATHPFYATVPVPHPFNKVPPTIRQPVLYSDVAPGNWVQDWQPYLRALTRANATGVTVAMSTFGTVSTSQYWNGGVLAPNGCIYCIPQGAPSILVINTLNDTVSTIGTVATNQYWLGGALAPNGNIYFIPYVASNVLMINPTTNTISYFGSITNNGRVGGVLAPNGNIYCTPITSDGVLVINTRTNTVSTFGSGLSGTWNGSILGPNGLIYGIPYGSTSTITVTNTTTNTVTTIGSLNTSLTWRFGTLAPNGNIYGIPMFASAASQSIILINPSTNTVSTFGTVSQGYNGGVLGPDGNIYCAPYSATNILVINPTTNALTYVGSGLSTSWIGGILAPNGNIYFIPYGSASVIKLTFTGLSQLPSAAYCLSAWANHL
jgi:hypothetical protein